jgi:4-carboxymuconolactone decarboxylase
MAMRRRKVAAAAVGLGLAAGAAGAAERFPALTPGEMSPQQKAAADKIVAGPRKSMGGPFNAWLRDPELADRLQAVGEQVRFRSVLPPRLNEFAILITAREWDADYEWYAHYPMGLKPGIAADLAKGVRPRGMAGDEAAVFDFMAELRRTRRVSDARYAAVQKLYGDQGVIDLVGLSGYYDLVSMTLNTAQVRPPEPGPLPLPPMARK